DTIIVPEEAWVDWDATNQVWITNGEKFTETQTARIKSVVHYPADLFSTIAWHDGSPLSAADFVMAMIMPFDLADPSSAIYDESLVGAHENFMSSFKGYRITSTNPLVIEYYSNASALDAELMVKSLWPNYGYGEGAWHVMALGYLAEAAGDTAFTSAKADANQVEWLNFISEPSLTMLKGHLDQAQTDTFIPYANTLNTYISPAAAVARYANLQTWYTNQGHFWMGTGPFYLDAVSFNDGSATLQRYAPFPDLATKWESFSHDATPANLSINYTSGAPGSFFNITGANFPINSVAWVYINDQFVGTTFTGATGDFIFTLATTPQTSDGEYNVTVSVNPTADITFEIDAQAPLRPQEGNYKVIDLPQEYIYLPLVLR
ncbi:MAG TPA: hypothetical protein DEH22_02190, partial [Chloroflexi bacterium]|nr:hypothetical protein [Chloroflexota bacterium]